MKYLHLLAIGLAVLCLNAQKQEELAPLKVIVTDFKGNKKSGEQVVLKNETTGKTYKGVTNKEGAFNVQIPGGATYSIFVKSVGEMEKTQTVAIPGLNEGEGYSQLTLTIQYEMPKTITLNNVLFDSGKATLRPSSYTELNELVELLKLKPDLRIEVAGHTDNVGEDDDNLQLSQKRADAVKNYLTKKGIAANRIVAKGYGETQPVASNETAEGKQLNRRTEVRFLK